MPDLMFALIGALGVCGAIIWILVRRQRAVNARLKAAQTALKGVTAQLDRARTRQQIADQTQQLSADGVDQALEDDYRD